MSHKLLILLLLFTLPPLFTRADTPAVTRPGPVIFFVQQDLGSGPDRRDFDTAFMDLVKALPKDRHVVFVSSSVSGNVEQYAGPARGLTWPPGKFHFGPRTRMTPFYANLLTYFEKGALSDCTVYVVGGESDRYDAGRSVNDLVDPNSSLGRLVVYCKKNRIRLTGFFVRKPGPLDDNESPSNALAAFIHATTGTGGKCFRDFSTFKGAFDSAFREYRADRELRLP